MRARDRRLRRRTHLRRLVLLAVLAIALVACQPSDPDPGADPQPPDGPVAAALQEIDLLRDAAREAHGGGACADLMMGVHLTFTGSFGVNALQFTEDEAAARDIFASTAVLIDEAGASFGRAARAPEAAEVSHDADVVAAYLAGFAGDLRVVGEDRSLSREAMSERIAERREPHPLPEQAFERVTEWYDTECERPPG